MTYLPPRWLTRHTVHCKRCHRDAPLRNLRPHPPEARELLGERAWMGECECGGSYTILDSDRRVALRP